MQAVGTVCSTLPTHGSLNIECSSELHVLDF